MEVKCYPNPLELTEKGLAWSHKILYLHKRLDDDGNLVEVAGSAYEEVYGAMAKVSKKAQLTQEEAELLFRYNLVQQAQEVTP